MNSSLSNEIMEMIKDILNSDLRPIEKLFLTIEWLLREQKPYEFYEIKFTDIKKNVEALIENQVSLGLKRAALEEGREIFQIEDQPKLFLLLTVLAYYSYITNEFVHDHEGRKELLLKLSETGFSLMEINRLNAKWIKVAGSSEELFNKIFQKHLDYAD